SLDSHRQRQRPGSQIVEIVVFFGFLGPLLFVRFTMLLLPHQKLWILGSFEIEERSGHSTIWLSRIDEIGTSRNQFVSEIAAAAIRSLCNTHFAISPGNFYALQLQEGQKLRDCRRVRIRNKIAFWLRAFDGRFEEIAIVPQPLPAVCGSRENGGKICRKMFSDAITKSQYSSIVSIPAISQHAAAVCFVCHSGRPMEGGPGIPVSWVKKIEHLPNEIGPTVSIEGGGIHFAEDFQPFRCCFCRQIRIDGKRGRREEVFFGLPMMVGQNLRMPFQESSGCDPGFGLTERNKVSVKIKEVVV